MEIETISLKNLSEIMTNYRPVYPSPYTWESTIAYMLKEDTERIVVEQLVEELKNSEQGTFREPVRLDKQEISPDEIKEDDYYTDILNNGYIRTENDGKTYSYTIGDGTHRIVAAYLYGAEEILTTNNSLSEDMSYFIVTSVKFAEKELNDEEQDLLVSCSRSLKISEKLWITSSLSTQDIRSTFIYWDIYSPEIDLNLITSKVQKTVQIFMPNVEFSVDTFLEPWDDEEEKEEVWDNFNIENSSDEQQKA